MKTVDGRPGYTAGPRKIARRSPSAVPHNIVETQTSQALGQTDARATLTGAAEIHSSRWITFGATISEAGLNRKSTLLGVVTVLFWLSFLAYLPRTTLTAEDKELVAEAREAREYAPEADRPREELEAELQRALRRVFSRWGVVVLLGVLSGVLLIVHPRSGRPLAVTLCSAMLLMKVVSFVSSYPHIGQRLQILFLVLLKWPAYVIHNDLVATVFYIGTIVMLLRARPPNNALQRTGSAGR